MDILLIIIGTTTKLPLLGETDTESILQDIGSIEGIESWISPTNLPL